LLSKGLFGPIDAILTPTAGLRLQHILGRIGNDQPLTLQERIDLRKVATNPMVAMVWIAS
jgi:hypothetical protein